MVRREFSQKNRPPDAWHMDYQDAGDPKALWEAGQFLSPL